jgi:hypothetical protein
MFTIQSAFQRRVVGEADGAAPMRTFEAGLVVRQILHSYLPPNQ